MRWAITTTLPGQVAYRNAQDHFLQLGDVGGDPAADHGRHFWALNSYSLWSWRQQLGNLAGVYSIFEGHL